MDPAADAREGDVRADRGAGVPDRRRATAGRAADDHGTSLHLAVRGPEAEGTVTSWAARSAATRSTWWRPSARSCGSPTGWDGPRPRPFPTYSSPRTTRS